MSMLGLALKAGVPLIRASTTDLVNLPDVLRHVAGVDVKEWPASGRLAPTSGLYYAVAEIDPTVDLYGQLVEQGSSLVVVNQGGDSPFPFNAGEVPVPKDMMELLLKEVVPKDQIDALVSCCSGLTLKVVSEVVRLVMAKDKSLTPKGVMAMRSLLAGKLQGLEQVDTQLPLYLCPPSLQQWVARNKKFFLDASDKRLVPRGVLLNGEPGTGKTTAAKYIAGQFEVPLYRLDLSSALGKYVGESEASFARVLSTLDQEAPAVVLVDEVEKLFAERDDSGVTSRLLSQMLWWGSEHTSRVLTVMTTNDMKALPKELYREGRIDTTLTIFPLKSEAAVQLAKAVLRQFVSKVAWSQDDKLERVIRKLGARVIHAKVVQTVYDLIKAGDLGKLNF
jgi:hypothetical protein